MWATGVAHTTMGRLQSTSRGSGPALTTGEVTGGDPDQSGGARR
jgi:hypothetical protein